MNMAVAFAMNGKDFFDAAFKILRIIILALSAIGHVWELGISDLPVNVA